MILDLTCKYCGSNWKMDTTYRAPDREIFCFVCGDKDIAVKDVQKSKIDYYQGSPEFPKKETKDRDLNWRLD